MLRPQPTEDKPERAEPLPCKFIGCDRFESKGQYCDGHRKQLERRGGVDKMTPIGHTVAQRGRVAELASRFARLLSAARGMPISELRTFLSGRTIFTASDAPKRCAFCRCDRMAHVPAVYCKAHLTQRYRNGLRGMKPLEPTRGRDRRRSRRKQGRTLPPCANPADPTSPVSAPDAPPSCGSGDGSTATTLSRCSEFENSSSPSDSTERVA